MDGAIGIKTSRQRPVEDIDAILGKFSAWSTSQRTDNRQGSRVAEVSYEQALHAASLRRTPGKTFIMTEKSRPPEPQPTAGPTVVLQPAAKEVAHKGGKARTRAPRTKRHTLKPAGIEGKSSHSCHGHEDQLQSLATPLVEIPLLKPSFGDLVRKQVAMVRDDSAAQGRRASLTVRLTPDEIALVKARAAEGEISVSAYLRQCALDVDVLRAQVETALAELRSAGLNQGYATKQLPMTDKVQRSTSDELLSRRPGFIGWALGLVRAFLGSSHFEGTA